MDRHKGVGGGTACRLHVVMAEGPGAAPWEQVGGLQSACHPYKAMGGLIRSGGWVRKACWLRRVATEGPWAASWALQA